MELQLDYANQILVFIVFAGSLNLLMGYAGQVSVAHGAFGAIGGYALAYLAVSHSVSVPMAVLIGVALAGLLGLIIALPALRLTTEWLILLTLAAQTIVISLVSISQALGGAYGLQNITGLSVFGMDLDTPSDLFPFFVVLAVVVLLLCWRLGESPYGRVLRGIREDELATRSLGKNVFAYKLTTFAITAAMAGLGGAMYVATTQIASPELFNFDLSTAIIVMVVFGGSGNLLGSVLAATALTLVQPLFENALDFDPSVAGLWRLVAYGALLIVVMRVRPQGLLPEGVLPFRSRKRRPHEATKHIAAPVVDSEAPEMEPAEPLAHPAPRAAQADAGPVALEVRGLTKRFGGITAAEDLNMDLRAGTISALVGPNGAGKTTVFNLLTGALRIDAGSVRLLGEEITGMRPDQVAAKGMVRSFQDVRIFPRLSVLENVMLAVPGQPGEHVAPLFGAPRKVRAAESAAAERAHEWLSFVGLESQWDVQAGSLGFGEQKLAALARVLATEAQVLLLDEPASGIDQRWVDTMLELIERLRPQGRTVCIVEHNLSVVGRLADHVYFMELGRITAEGSFEELTGERRLAEAYFGT